MRYCFHGYLLLAWEGRDPYSIKHVLPIYDGLWLNCVVLWIKRKKGCQKVCIRRKAWSSNRSSFHIDFNNVCSNTHCLVLKKQRKNYAVQAAGRQDKFKSHHESPQRGRLPQDSWRQTHLLQWSRCQNCRVSMLLCIWNKEIDG